MGMLGLGCGRVSCSLSSLETDASRGMGEAVASAGARDMASGVGSGLRDWLDGVVLVIIVAAVDFRNFGGMQVSN